MSQAFPRGSERFRKASSHRKEEKEGIIQLRGVKIRACLQAGRNARDRDIEVRHTQKEQAQAGS